MPFLVSMTGFSNLCRLTDAHAAMGTRVLAEFTLALVFLVALVPTAGAEPLSSSEMRKIEALIKGVEDLKDAAFIRNGSRYDAAQAATFLRRKWAVNHALVRTARDFIDRVASFSGTSGNPYVIRFNHGKEVKSRDFLLAELAKIESSDDPRWKP